MQLVCALLALCLLLLNLLVVRLSKRVTELEHSKAALDILAEQVCELSDDFYGPAAE